MSTGIKTSLGLIDPFMGFDHLKLYVIREVEHAKVEGERLREKLFEQWVIKHSNG